MKSDLWTNGVTPRQIQILDIIRTATRERGFAPSYEEIGRLAGLSSLATVHKHIQNLKNKGLLRHKYNRARSIQPTDFCPLCGRSQGVRQ